MCEILARLQNEKQKANDRLNGPEATPSNRWLLKTRYLAAKRAVKAHLENCPECREDGPEAGGSD